jgi:SagB-type dehydrogenase family enzyme
MPAALSLRLRSGAELERLPAGALALVAGQVRVELRRPSPAVAAALVTLAEEGAEEDALFESAAEKDGDDGVLALQLLLRQLEAGGWTERSVRSDGACLATLKPLGHAVPVGTRRLDPEAELTLSRFALLRAEDGELLVESPLALQRLVLHEPRLAALVAALASPIRPAELDGGGPSLPEGAVQGTLQLLLDAGLAGEPGAEDGEDLAQWSFADLLFHARSRVGRNLGGYGGTYPLPTTEPLPAVRTAFPMALELPRPDVERLVASDPPFARVFEERISVRAHDDARPIAAAQLGELLYRVARVRARFRDERQELSRRPLPGGGSAYELEIYPLVRLCAGVEPGLYHYDPERHALGAVAEPGPETEILLEYGRHTAAMDGQPQVLLLIAARFGRVMWKYESMAYALVLKHVGVLYQSLYLAATAMGLAPCALGGGSSDAFGKATGLGFGAETTVGEFVLGSRIAGDQPTQAGARAAAAKPVSRTKASGSARKRR